VIKYIAKKEGIFYPEHKFYNYFTFCYLAFLSNIYTVVEVDGLEK
jgi:hypothetical protein